MSRPLLAITFATLSFFAQAESRVTYVGDGRTACSGNSSACAQADANNRQRESQRASDYQREQDRAQDYVDRERSKERERREDLRRNR